jgi:hypothetical protein
MIQYLLSATLRCFGAPINSRKQDDSQRNAEPDFHYRSFIMIQIMIQQGQQRNGKDVRPGDSRNRMYRLVSCF